MPTLDKPKGEPQIDEIDPETGKPKYGNYGEFRKAEREWDREQALREFQEMSANTHKEPRTATSGSEFRSVIFRFAFLALLAYGGWAGISMVADAIKSRSTAKASVPDLRDQQIKELSAKVAVLEAKPKTEPHYEFREVGYRTWRFDPATGTSCVQLTTKPDWKQSETIKESCLYQDFIAANPTDPKIFDKAECYFVNSAQACKRIWTTQ